jgi:hypothetical protein
MDWLNLHISVLDSPQVLRCDPVRRATWLFLLRYCISQENGGLIEDCAAWGDTSWQQIVRVKLREVRAESPLWTWEGNNLRVTFYPSEKETEVQAKRTGGTYGGKAATEAKAQAARDNGRKGGRPKTQAETQADETQEPKLNPTEGNGKERKGMEVSAAAPPHAQEPTPPEPGLFDSSPAIPRPTPKADWFYWRQTHPRIFVSRSDEDGRLADWQALFDRAGPEVMTAMYAAVLPSIPAPRGIGYGAAVRWINDNTTETPEAP